MWEHSGGYARTSVHQNLILRWVRDEFNLKNMSHFVDWERSASFEVIRGEGECAV